MTLARIVQYQDVENSEKLIMDDLSPDVETTADGKRLERELEGEIGLTVPALEPM